jgi:hypothetical protein
MSATRSLAVILAVILGLSGVAFAQATGPTEQVKQWNFLIGKWINQEEQRESPVEPWQSVSSQWDIRWLPGGFYVESPGKMVFPDGREDSWYQIWGFDPADKTHFNMWFNNVGGIGKQTFKWSGTTLEVEGTDTSADGTKSTIRCTWKHLNDYSASDGQCERLTDGKWWVYRKVKGSKQ